MSPDSTPYRTLPHPTHTCPLPPHRLTIPLPTSVKGRPTYHSAKKEEYAHIRFDLSADLSPLFTWNTKQVFLYITASYPATSPTSPPSRSIIWDAVLAHPLAPTHHNQYTKHLSSTPAAGPGLLRLPGQRPKYQITDPSGRLASRANATLELAYNVQPWVGALTWAAGVPAFGSSAAAGTAAPWWDAAFVRPLRALTWRALPVAGAQTAAFKLPALKERKEAGGLGTEKGGEGNRGKPA